MKYWVRLEKLKKTRFSGTTISCSGDFYKTLVYFMWKNKKYTEKVQWKCPKRQFPAYFRHFRPEKVFIKNRTRPYFGHCYYTFLNKESVKTNDEISRKCQKPGFSGIFPAFSAGKICFSKIGLGHILNIAILHQCAKFHEKI